MKQKNLLNKIASFFLALSLLPFGACSLMSDTAQNGSSGSESQSSSSEQSSSTDSGAPEKPDDEETYDNDGEFLGGWRQFETIYIANKTFI